LRWQAPNLVVFAFYSPTGLQMAFTGHLVGHLLSVSYQVLADLRIAID